jgi:hypothetical protein
MVLMPGWTCPQCRRLFRRAGQTHECAPAMSLEEYFVTGPAHERQIAEAVIDLLRSVGRVHVEPVSVGIFLKRTQTFAELRPKDRWVALSFSLPRRVEHPLITRKVVSYHGRYHHVANLRSAADLDDRLRSWLTEAYLNSPE